MSQPNEYLTVYQQMLAHQREHGGVLPSLYGVEQPMQVCTRCPPAEDSRWWSVKKRFAWAVPTEKALTAIADWSPRGVVEIGAGGGYWTMLLRERGVDVIAYDPDPTGEQAGWHDGHRWSEVLTGDHTSVIGHPDRTLFLCWPMYDAAWSHKAVELYGGDTVIYVGEGPGGCTGDDRMHVLLGAEHDCLRWGESCDCDPPAPVFKEVSSVGLPQWSGLHDDLYIYQRVAG